MPLKQRTWPARVLRCLDCLVAAETLKYGGRGLCANCYEFHKGEGTLANYRIKRTADKTNPCKALIRTIGVTASTRISGYAERTLRSWALKGLPTEKKLEFMLILRRIKEPSEEDRAIIFQ